MTKKPTIVAYTSAELDELRRKNGTKTDWDRIDAMTEEELEAAIASDPDEAGLVWNWDNAVSYIPEPKAVLNMRIDRDILDFFREDGKGYQTRINAVLRSYVEAHKKRAG